MSPGPLIHSGRTTRVLMLQVLAALSPAVAAAVARGGVHAAASLALALAASWIAQAACTRRCALHESALVTGAIVVLTLPMSAPNWLAALGGALAVVQTGAADADGDGQVELRELYEYLRQQTCPVNLRIYGKQEHFILARNPYHFIPVQPIKWDLISGAILAPVTIIIIGGRADLRTAIGLAGLLLLMYALLYLAPD